MYWYDIEQSDGEAPVMRELLETWSTPSLQLFPRPFGPGVVSPDRVLSKGQIEQFEIQTEYKQMNYVKSNCLK